VLDEIVSQLEKYSSEIIKVENSWDYLLDLKLWTLTEEKIKECDAMVNDKVDHDIT
jgi:hypothetical protein